MPKLPVRQVVDEADRLPLSEAEAHLRRLVKLGRVEAVAGSDPVTYVAAG